MRRALFRHGPLLEIEDVVQQRIYALAEMTRERAYALFEGTLAEFKPTLRTAIAEREVVSEDEFESEIGEFWACLQRPDIEHCAEMPLCRILDVFFSPNTAPTPNPEGEHTGAKHEKMSATRVIDPTAGMPESMRRHLHETAEESGEDLMEYRSCEETVGLPDGRICETWYDENSASALTAFKGFVAGVGTHSGASREEVIASFSAHQPGS